MNNKFASLGIALSRDEAKKVMGGLVEGGGGAVCNINLACTLFVQATNTTYSGTCQSGWGGGSGGVMPCSCETNYGPYVPSSGTSHCVSNGISEV